MNFEHFAPVYEYVNQIYGQTATCALTIKVHLHVNEMLN